MTVSSRSQIIIALHIEAVGNIVVHEMGEENNPPDNSAGFLCRHPLILPHEFVLPENTGAKNSSDPNIVRVIRCDGKTRVF
jgi:hypothetical protein